MGCRRVWFISVRLRYDGWPYTTIDNIVGTNTEDVPVCMPVLISIFKAAEQILFWLVAINILIFEVRRCLRVCRTHFSQNLDEAMYVYWYKALLGKQLKVRTCKRASQVEQKIHRDELFLHISPQTFLNGIVKHRYL